MIHLILGYRSRFSKKDDLIGGKAADKFWHHAARAGLFQTDFSITLASQHKKNELPQKVKKGDILLLLGTASLRLYDNKHTLNDLRGAPFKVGDHIAIASYHPQDAVDARNYEASVGSGGDLADEDKEDDTKLKDHTGTARRNFGFWLYQDLHKLGEVSREGILSYPFKSNIHPDEGEILLVLRRILQADPGWLYLDIEVDTQTNNLTCVGISYIPFESNEVPKVYVIPFFYHNFTRPYPNASGKIMLRLFKAMQKHTVVAHNGACFDFPWMSMKFQLPFPTKVYDTMVAHHRLYPTIEKSLGHCISLYTHIPYHKDEGIWRPHNKRQEMQLWKYNAKDIATMVYIHREIMKRAEGQNAEASIKQANESIPSLLAMTMLGIRVDKDARATKVDDLERRIIFFERLLTYLVGFELNPKSPKQVREYLFDPKHEGGLALTPRGKTDSGELSVNNKVLQQLAVKHPQIISLQNIIVLREMHKMLSSIQPVLIGGNRTSTLYKPTGTKTYRLSSVMVKVMGKHQTYGENMQNKDKAIRHLFIPDPGKSLIQIDQKGAEAFVVAYLTRPGRFRRLFLNGIKSHSYVALHVFKDKWKAEGINAEAMCKLEPEDLIKHPDWSKFSKLIKSPKYALEYFLGKKTCHAANYDMKAPTFVASILAETNGLVVLSVREGRRLLETYHSLFPEISGWHQNTQLALKKYNKVLKNLFGYPRRFFGPDSPTLHRDAYAFVPQSTVGVITIMAHTEIQQRIDSGDPTLEYVDVLQNGHDSVLLQAPQEKAAEVAVSCRKHLEKDLVSPRGEKFTMATEVGIGPNWKELDESIVV